MKLKIALLLTALMASTSAYAEDCTPKLKFPTVTEGTITVAATTYVPYSYIDKSGELKGVDGDIVKEIAKLACLTVTPIASDSASAIQSVISGRADFATGAFYRTEARSKVVNLSDPLYLDQVGVYTKDGRSSFKEIENGTVGSLQGSLWVNDVRKFMGDRLRLYPDTVSMHQDLMNGRVDALVDGYSLGVVAQQEGGLQGIQIKVLEADDRVASSVEAGQGTLPVKKANDDLLKATNEALAELHKSGKIADILEANGLSRTAADTGAPRLLK